MRWLGERREVLAVDTETSGLDPERCVLRLVQFGDEHAGWSVPWERWGGVALEALGKYTGELVGHNVKFDTRFIELHGRTTLPHDRVHDTMIMAHLINPAAAKGLKPLAARLVDSKAAYASKALDEAMAKAKWDWGTVPITFPMYWGYGALDTVLTAHLHRVLRPQVEAEYHDVYELERAVGWVLMGMEARGIRVDLDYTAQKREELQAYAASVADWCKATYSISPGSNAAVTAKLAELGVELTKRTSSGALALDEEVILDILGVEDLEDAAPETPAQHLAYLVLKRRKAEKIRSTYLETFMKQADANGVVHCRINQLGARTGRMSIDTPALQTLTRGTIVRDCFVPRDDASIISADYDQVEVRLTAHWAQTQAFTDAINSGDIHSAAARLIYKDDSITKKDPRRQLAKNSLFARLYGAGTHKIALTAGVDDSFAKGFVDAYNQAFPGVGRFLSSATRLVEQREKDEGVGWVKTPLGRRLVLEPGKAYAGVNALIQGTAGDVLKEALVRLDEAGVDGMLVPVHDEILIETDAVDEVKRIVLDVMTDTRWLVPLTVGVDGPLDRWGTKYR